MSLKAFHIFFIVVSMVFVFGFAAWEIFAVGQDGSIALAAIGLVSGVGLTYYFGRMLKKFKQAHI
jgi:hypothetical protein